MHRSGIICDQKIKDAFNEAVDDKGILYLKIHIQDEKFVKDSTGAGPDGFADGTVDEKKCFSIVAGACTAKKPAIILMRLRKKWLPIQWIPDNGPIKPKMLIASSFADLKAGVGASYFLNEYPISSTDECTVAAYNQSISVVGDEILTWQELEAKETAHDSSMAMSESKVSAVVSLHTPVSATAEAAIDSFLENKINTILFEMDMKSEELTLNEEGTIEFDAIAAKLPDREPRYILHNFAHDKDGTSLTKPIFIYYCPDKAKPRLRMFYSTAKANVLTVLNTKKIDEAKRLEISLASELTPTLITDELYPKCSVKKVFKKPGRQGKGRAKFTGKKFSPG